MQDFLKYSIIILKNILSWTIHVFCLLKYKKSILVIEHSYVLKMLNTLYHQDYNLYKLSMIQT